MKIVIDIPDEQAKFNCTFQFRILCDNGEIVGLIDNKYFEERYGIKSTVLPKGCGDLIDRDELFTEYPEIAIEPYINVPIVIKSDKGE